MDIKIIFAKINGIPCRPKTAKFVTHQKKKPPATRYVHFDNVCSYYVD